MGIPAAARTFSIPPPILPPRYPPPLEPRPRQSIHLSIRLFIHPPKPETLLYAKHTRQKEKMSIKNTFPLFFSVFLVF